MNEMNGQGDMIFGYEFKLRIHWQSHYVSLGTFTLILHFNQL